MKTGFFRILFALVCVFLLYGCAVIDKQLLDPAASHAKVNPLFRSSDCRGYEMPKQRLIREGGGIFVKDPCEYQALSINDISQDNKDDLLYGKMCSLDDNGKFKNQGDGAARNCLNYLISRSNEICDLHKSHIYGDRTVMNTILGTLALGAGVAGTMTGAGAAHFLAGSAGFLTGSQALMDKEIYRNFVTHAILVKIDTNRSDFLKLPELAYLDEKNDDTKIGYAKVRNNAETYHNLCSFYDGLKSLLKEAGGSNKTEAVNAVLVSQFEAKMKLVKFEIDDIQNQLKVSGIPDENKKELEAKLESKKRELSHITEVLSAIGGDIDKKPETDKTPEAAKAPDNISSICTPEASFKKSKLIKDVQEALKKAKSEPGPGASDGIAGPKTCNAIRVFQNKNNLLPVTGEPDSNTLKSLGLDKDK